jgi:hypothetical protein
MLVMLACEMSRITPTHKVRLALTLAGRTYQLVGSRIGIVIVVVIDASVLLGFQSESGLSSALVEWPLRWRLVE